jgi:transcriptional regulator with XRE-family HTH domain
MNKLKQRRRMLGLTQFDIAKQAGILYSRITFAESGRRRLTKEEINRIQKVLVKRAQQIAGAVA